jgi:hypothetical protein
MRHIPHVLVVAVLLLAGASAPARADVSKKVQAALKGQIFFSADGLPQQAEDDATTIKAIKKAGAATLGHAMVEGVPTWRFHFMAFMSQKPAADQVSLDFYVDDKTHAFVAQKRLAGIDANLMMLETEVAISEDDGLSAGKSYVVKLATSRKGKEVVLATAKVKTK